MRRSLASLAIFLMLGAVCNIAVAWWLAVRDPQQPVRELTTLVWSRFGESRWICREIRLRQSRGALRLSERESTISHQSPSVIEESEFMAKLPRASRFHDGPPIDYLSVRSPVMSELDQPNALYEELYTGWPLYTLCYRKLDAEVKTATGARSIESRSSAGLSRVSTVLSPSSERASLPWLPLWSGVAVNVPLHALAVFLLWRAMLLPWRCTALLLRRWTGRCGHCGYDLRGAEHARCPECGADIATHSTRQQASALSGERKENP